ncbi:MAG: NADP-dependent oxidoreductase [Pseudomonadota bacterium]
MQRIVLASRPEGRPTPTDFRLEDAPAPTLEDGHVLCEVMWLSLDPYMRGRMDDAKSYADPVPLGGVMEGGTVARVIESRSSRFEAGDIVEGRLGWQTHGTASEQAIRKLDPALAPPQTALGVLGMPGFTAWIGLLEHGQPEPGQTLVVSAATGAVGALVGQLGKRAGLRVVGIAGGTDKCAYAVDTLGFDACVDHRALTDTRSLSEALKGACPDGVDIYYENVGGKSLRAVLPRLNVGARIPVCGMISWYNGRVGETGDPMLDSFSVPQLWRTVLVNRLSVRGFIITDHYARFGDFLRDVGPAVGSGDIVYRESVSEGLASAPEAFIGLLGGANFGKQLVRIAE